MGREGYKRETSSALLHTVRTVLTSRIDFLDNSSVFIYDHTIIPSMKVSVILTATCLCLAGLIEAGPIIWCSPSRIVKNTENGEKDTDYDYMFSCLYDFMRDASEGVRSFPKVHKNKFIDRFFLEVKRCGSVMEEFAKELVSHPQFQDGLEECVIFKSSSETSEVFLGESPKVNGKVGDAYQNAVGTSELSSESKLFTSADSQNSRAMKPQEKRQKDKEEDYSVVGIALGISMVLEWIRKLGRTGFRMFVTYHVGDYLARKPVPGRLRLSTLDAEN